MPVDTSFYRSPKPQQNYLSDFYVPSQGRDLIGAMQARRQMDQMEIRNRLLFMEEQQRAEDLKAEQARREFLIGQGVPGAQANAAAQVAPPPQPPQNALAGNAVPPTQGPPPGWTPPMALPPEAAAPVSAQETPRPGYGPGVSDAVQRYSPEAWGRRVAQEELLKKQRDEALATFQPVFKAVVDAGDQDAMNALLRAAKKNPALKSIVDWVGDPDGPEDQQIKITGKGESETTSTYSKEQLGHIAAKAGSPEMKEAILSSPPGSYKVKSKGGRIVGFEPGTKAASGAVSDIGKLIADRDVMIASRVASGMKPEDAMKDPDVMAFDDAIKKKSTGAGAYPVGHVQQFQVGRRITYKEFLGNGQWKERPDLGGGDKDLPPQYADDFKVWDKDTKEWHFENFKSTGVKPDFGWGRDAGRSRAQFQKEYAAWNLGKGVSGAEAGTVSASFKAKAMSLRNQEKIRGMMGGFVRNMDKQIVRVDDLFNKIVQRVGVRALDYPLREIKTRAIGSGSEAIIEAYLLEISNEIGKLSTGSAASIQELSKEAQVKWAKIHDPNLSPKEIKKILTETRHMGQLRLDSTDEEIKRYLDDMANMGKEAKEAKTGDAKVEPRKPGESVSDYLRRTKKP